MLSWTMLKSQIPANSNCVLAVWVLTCTDYATGSKVCWRGCMTELTTYTNWTMWPSSRSPHSTFHLLSKGPFRRNHWWAHNHTSDVSACHLSYRCYDENINTNPKEHHGEVCGETGRSTRFVYTCGPHLDVIACCCVRREEGCGSFEAHTKEETPAPILSVYAMTYMQAF